MAGNELARRDKNLPVVSPKRPSLIPTTSSSSSLSLESVSAKSGKTSQEIYTFLEQLVTGGWLPRFQHGFDAFSSLAYCLINVTEARYGELKARGLDAGQGTVLLTGSGSSLRQEIESCRTRCTDILNSLSADMREVSSMSLRLSVEDGPVSLLAFFWL